MEPKYRPEPFDSTIEPTEVTVSHVAAGREGVAHPIKEFVIMPESLAGLASVLIISLIGLGLLANAIWLGSANRIQSVVAWAPGCLWLFFHTVKALRRRDSFDWHDSITLDTDRLICDQSHKSEAKIIHYEQICTVKLRIVRSPESEQTAAGPVTVNYYEYDKQTSTLNLSRLRSLILPRTGDDAGLCDEIQTPRFRTCPQCIRPGSA